MFYDPALYYIHTHVFFTVILKLFVFLLPLEFGISRKSRFKQWFKPSSLFGPEFLFSYNRVDLIDNQVELT